MEHIFNNSKTLPIQSSCGPIFVQSYDFSSHHDMEVLPHACETVNQSKISNGTQAKTKENKNKYSRATRPITKYSIFKGNTRPLPVNIKKAFKVYQIKAPSMLMPSLTLLLTKHALRQHLLDPLYVGQQLMIVGMTVVNCWLICSRQLNTLV